jgi:hypothetical protein
LGEKISLTKRQVKFITEMLEIEDPEKAAEFLMEMMVNEGVKANLICEVIDRSIKKLSERAKK